MYKKETMCNRAVTIGAIATSIMGCLFCIAIAILGLSWLNLSTASYRGEAELKRAEWNRRIIILEAKAKRDSAIMLAEAEIERAKGVAQANKIIGNSLNGNEAYLRYLWIDSLHNTKDQIIYVPTEAGLPILEARNRRQNN